MRVSNSFRALLVALLPAATGLLQADSAPLPNLIIVKSRDLAPYNEAVRGLRATLTAWDPALPIRETVLPPGFLKEDSFIESLHRSRPALIVAVGTQATQAVTRRVTDVPVVFSMVLTTGDPGNLFRGRASNVTGAGLDIPIPLQFSRLQEVVPGVRRVGVLFNPRETGRVIESAEQAAAGAGLTLVEIPVTSEAQVLAEMGQLKGRVDALWSVADSTVFTPRSVDYILLRTLQDGIPLVGLSPSFVKAGALLAFACDYVDVGAQSGEIAIQVLEGKAPGEIPVVYPRQVHLYLNLNTARALNLDISPRIRAEARVDFKP